MSTLSIVTPTYNRLHTIKRLYESLVSQNSYDFDWVVIDDGSTDLTEEYFTEIEKISLFKIIYHKVDNGGKHRALNIAMEYVTSEICMCVDSDDWLPKDAVGKIITNYVEHVKTSDRLIGIISKRGYYKDGKLESITTVKTDIIETTMFDFHYKYGCTGDTALIFKTAVAKKECFKEYENENFISEISLYYLLDEYGVMYVLNDIVYLNEYQPDGLTANYIRLLEKNPNGTAYMYYVMLSNETRPLFRMKYLALANYYYRLAKKNLQLSDVVVQNIGNKVIPSILGFFVGIVKKKPNGWCR